MRTVLIMQILTARSQLGPQLALGGRLLFFTRLVVPGFASVAQGYGRYPLIVRHVTPGFLLNDRLLFLAGIIIPGDLGKAQSFCSSLCALATCHECED